MAKYYEDAASTPVFAVTFVSNRDGIVNSTDGQVTTSNNTNTNTQNSNQAKSIEDITNADYKFSSDSIKQGYLVKVDRVNRFKSQVIDQFKRQGRTVTSNFKYVAGLTPEIEEFQGFSLDDLRADLFTYVDTNMKGYLPSNVTAATAVEQDIKSNTASKIKDTEYLIYSNLPIVNVGGSDLSQQSNWYLTEAEVELTRDWPICKAKLVVTCKLNDDGTIPSIVEVEKGFTYGRENNQLTLLKNNEGRLLSADDEVRIYAGYKSEPCISMNDLDDYPYSFSTLKTNKLDPEKDKDTIKEVQSLQKQKEAIQDEINKLYSINLPFIGDAKGRELFGNNEKLLKDLNTKLQELELQINNLQRDKGIQKADYTADKDKLAPIFWGFIDTVDFIGSANSIQIIYNLRDRSRILADTKLITLPYLNENKGERGTFEGLRHKTLEGVYRAANGGIYLDNNYKSASGLEWRKGFNVGEVITLYDNKIDLNDPDKKRRINDQTATIQEIYTDALAEQRIKYAAAIEDPSRWVIANTFLSSTDISSNNYNDYDPLFHIWTLMPPLVSGSGATNMQIINKSPFEILGYMQVTEVMPIDCYASHVNGHFIFGPRILDTSGLDDPDRGNRTYFFFDCFDKLPESRSLIKNIRVQTSTIGVYNRFTVASADFNNATNASLGDLLSIVDITPVNTRNRKVPIKQHIITDPKIAKENNKEGAAQALALTTASNMARDNTTIIFKVLGDSSFCPGEAVRVFNTVLHSKNVFTFNGQTATSSAFLKTLYDKVEELKKKNGVKQVDGNKKIANLSQVLEEIRNNSGALTDDLNNALPMYKVRAITHSLKATGADAGFITKIVAIADII